MADATGSIAFLGAARFQGYWNAATNEATGSALDGAKFTSTNIGLIPGLFETGSSAGGGYGTGGPNVTASAGDYWQVTGSGTHNADGTTNWNLNDWCIYSGSASGAGSWKKLAFEDTIASIVIGDLSSSSFHMGMENDKHVLFDSGSVHSGSDNFVYDYNNNRIGIGTASPSERVDVSITGENGGIRVINDTDNAYLKLDAPSDEAAYIDFSTGESNDWQIGRRPGSNDLTVYDNDGATDYVFTWQQGGNVGIGTTIPEHTLSVTGNIGASGGVVSSFIGNPSSLNYDVTIPASTNAIMYGPITVAATKTITISDTAVLKIIDISEL